MPCSRDFPRAPKPVTLLKEAMAVVPVAARVAVACRALGTSRLVHDRDTMETSLQTEGAFLLIVRILCMRHSKGLLQDSSA